MKSVKAKENQIIEERTRTIVLMQELQECMAGTESMHDKRLQIKKQGSHDKHSEAKRGLSPFEKRLVSYQN
jgi:hypothetical protein